MDRDDNKIIRFPNGLFYTGRAGHGEMGPRREAFLYTQEGAENKIARLGKQSMMWRDAEVWPYIEEVEIYGTLMPMNIWGHATIILTHLYKEGMLPDLHIYGTDDPEQVGMYLINNEPVGKTLDEVLVSIWKMVACWKKNGYLFEN